jgi:Na+/proline symporter
MLSTETILFVSLCYIGLLFAIAYYGDKRADAGRSLINSPYVYALSLAVYCTAWTFYGSVGRAVRSGPGFLAIYIGPTLVATLGWGRAAQNPTHQPNSPHHIHSGLHRIPLR